MQRRDRIAFASLVTLIAAACCGCQSPFGKDKPPRESSGWEVDENKDFMADDMNEIESADTNVSYDGDN